MKKDIREEKSMKSIKVEAPLQEQYRRFIPDARPIPHSEERGALFWGRIWLSQR